MSKFTIMRAKEQPTEDEKTIANYISGVWLVSNIYKELKSLNIKKTDSPT